MDLDSLIKKLLLNRKLVSSAEIQEFFSPTNPKDISLSQVGLKRKSVSQAIQLIKRHTDLGHKIAIYGDYDVDGICSTAILWETLYRNYKNVFPYIPHRRTEGYGLSIAGLDACLKEGAQLIITVDNGIVAHEEIKYCREQGSDLIVVDHHEPGETLPQASAILHSQKTSAAGLAWFFAREYSSTGNQDLMSLAAISVICDLVPLLGINRSLAKFGLQELNHTSRPGLLALFDLAGIRPGSIDTYVVGFMLGPRLNAMGRLEHALDSLRLICTQNSTQASILAHTLSDTNSLRQEMTETSIQHALSLLKSRYQDNLPKLLVVADESYDQGIIGLIASKLTEKYSRPAIAISLGEKESKASARSVSGFNITEHIRTVSHLLLSVGGHPMASGFTVESHKVAEVQEALVSSAENLISDNLLVKKTRVDETIPLDLVTWELYRKLEEFAPFGLGNPRPVFQTPGVTINNPRTVGKTGNHLKFQATNNGISKEAIWFNAPPLTSLPSTPLSLIYQVSANEFNGQTNLQLQIKDIII